MACWLFVPFLAVGVFLGCGASAPPFSGVYSQAALPFSPHIIDVLDVNATLIKSHFPNLTITYDGRPLFLRFTNVTASGNYYGLIQLTLPPQMLAAYTSLFPGLVEGFVAANFSLSVVRVPHICLIHDFFVRDVVLYLAEFVDVGIAIPRAKIYSISFEYGD